MAKFLVDYYFQYNFQKYGFMIKKKFHFCLYLNIIFFNLYSMILTAQGEDVKLRE